MFVGELGVELLVVLLVGCCFVFLSDCFSKKWIPGNTLRAKTLSLFFFSNNPRVSLQHRRPGAVRDTQGLRLELRCPWRVAGGTAGVSSL